MNQKTEWGIFFARIILGGIMFAHGLQKFMMMDMMTNMFADGFGLPSFLAYVVATIEVVGGAALIIGIFVKTSAIAIGLVMIGAMVTVKLPMVGFFGNGQMPGYELDLALLALSIVLALTGSRKLALSKE
jgi:putative oxidoreductase